MSTVSRAVVVDETVLTVPVTGDVSAAIRGWELAHIDDLDRRLAPYGISASDLTVPEHHRIVTRDDLPMTARSLRGALGTTDQTVQEIMDEIRGSRG